ncbi:MAG: metallophosphatase [Oscillatoriales cyanobacterium RM2_1_1]|nr:metallophosphatase [Oscillatoriales cyanobacterium SM2_3_0]NJO47990.1 metallophosphatase [Oscillatoriales cyanobacterium RM2_1_1]
MWAILSGIEGNLVAYEAVLDDIQKHFVQVEQLYILGDLVGPNSSAEIVVQRVRQPQKLQPQVCIGWWEEQCFNLYGLGGNSEAQELLSQYDGDTIKLLWNSVSRETVQWLRQQHFGFVELDCLLIHASNVSVSDQLTPETSVWKIIDRLQRADVNQIFCGRSGMVFEYVIQNGSVASTVSTLAGDQPSQAISLQEKRLIGVGSVGRYPGKATYTLYRPGSNKVQFQTVYY